MSEIVLYSTGCPKCRILEKKLSEIGVSYDVVNDVDTLIAKGFKSAPVLDVAGRFMTFPEAVEWIAGE